MSGLDTGNPTDPKSTSVPPLTDQAEIDLLMAQARAPKSANAAPAPKPAKPRTPVPAPTPFEPGIDLGLISQDEIDSVVFGEKAGPKPKPASAAPESRAPDPAQTPALGQSEIDLLLAKADAEPTNFAAAEAALRKIDQSEIDAMLASGKMKDALGDDVLSDDAAGSSETLSQEELDKLLTSAGPENSLGGGELDAVLAPAESMAASGPAIGADAAPATLRQEELEALLAAHPMARAEPPAPLPTAQASEEDPVQRAARENTQANVGRENLAAAVPDPTAGEQPLGQDLIDSLIAQAAQAASSPSLSQARGKGPANAQGSDLKGPETGAVSLSDDDFADMGISIPTPQVSIVSEPAEGPGVPTQDASAVVQRRLGRGAKFPAKIAASIAASLIVGSGTFAYLWSHRTRPAGPPTQTAEAKSRTLEETIALARDLMGKGEHVGAMRELGAAIGHAEQGPLLDEARFLHVEAGYRSLSSNPKEVDVETVLKNIEDVIALAPEYARNPEALAWKAELFERTGAFTTARDTYDRILTAYPNAPDTDNTLLQLARLAFQLDYFDDAEKALGRIVQDFPQSSHKSEAQMMLAKCYESTGRVADAAAAYASVAAERTESRAGAEAALALARVENESGDIPGAIRALETRLQTATTVDGNDAVYVELAKAYRAAGKPADAVRIARELLNFFPESVHIPEAVVELTRALEANGESRQALELAQQAADRFDKNAEVAKNRALMLSKSGDARAAAESLEKADDLGANDPEVLLDAGKKYLELSESDKAAKLFQRVVEKYPGSGQAVEAGVELGRHEYRTGNIAGAIDRLVALAGSPNASEKQLPIQSALGDIYTDLGLTKRATAAYEKVASLATDPETLARAATALLKNGAMGPALPVIRKVDAARLPSKSGFDFLMAQGRAMLALDPDAALTKMQQAFEQYPVERTPEDFEYLVRACLETGKTAHARMLVSDFDTYVQTHPEDRDRLQRTAALWGDALYNAGDYRGALDAYALAVPPPAGPQATDTAGGQTSEPAPPTRDAVWATFQRANAMLKLDDFANSLPIFDELASTDTPYAEDARIKAGYARLERRLRAAPPVVGEGG
jgi:tetratricopeptide (TPR) repeat protein